MRVLARGKFLRGSALDVFGHTAERRMERELIQAYEARVHELLPQLTAERLPLMLELLALPQSMRGFGHVKARNVERARRREAELLHRLDPQRYPRPQGAPLAGQFKGIEVRAA